VPGSFSATLASSHTIPPPRVPLSIASVWCVVVPPEFFLFFSGHPSAALHGHSEHIVHGSFAPVKCSVHVCHALLSSFFLDLRHYRTALFPPMGGFLSVGGRLTRCGLSVTTVLTPLALFFYSASFHRPQTIKRVQSSSYSFLG